MPPEAIFAAREILSMMVVGLTLVGIAFSPLPKALGQRLLHGKLPPPGTSFADPRLDEVMDENAMLRRQLTELEERLSFTERMLAQVKEKGALPGVQR
jgi:hypothetical protein